MVSVFDASAIFPLFVTEDKSQIAKEVFSQHKDIIFIDYILIEISNGLASSVRRQRITKDFALNVQKNLHFVINDTIKAHQYLNAAFELSLSINHPVYDCLYAVAAKENNAILVTADEKFAQKLDENLYKTHIL